ncbi:hypothetical protein LWI29_009538 [Acer saccharum]|uniref:C-JID domain-containing protein n=1 Tax=Acer saccharum TaxID=4024 RepID=A0AA39RVA7_ACESA|nr:hypothetical protein LWI29_009538 [Acer saccharum]
MYNLRILNFYDWSQEFGDPTNACKVQLPYGLNYLPDGLRSFHWLRYPSKVLPSKLNLDHLVELDLFESNVEQLWEGKQDVPMLRRLILGLSRNLTRIPDLSGSPYLEELQKEVNIDICYPGNEIPDWFSYPSFGSSMFIQLPQPNGCNRKILGVALCVVIAFKECCFNDIDHLRVRVPFVCCVHPRTIDHRLVKLEGYLTVRDDREYTDKISIDMDHVVLGYRSYPNVKILEDDYATCTVKFAAPDVGQNCKVKYCGVSLVYAEPEIIQPSISVEKFGSTNQDSGEAMVEEIPNEAETSQSENGSGNDRYEDEEKDPQPKPVTGNNSMLLINNKVGPFYRTLCDRFGLLRCYCWNFLVCLFYRLCAVYGETNIIQPCISPEKFNATNQASEETMVESYTKFPNEADTSARGSGKSAHFINNKVFLLHHTLLKGVVLLHYYFWSFLPTNSEENLLKQVYEK